MYRCILALTNLSIWITTVASIVALFSPFWYKSMSSGSDETRGLYMRCVDPYGANAKCEFNDGVSTDTPWFTACQGLWTAGTALMFILAICSFCLCCDACRNYACAILVAIGVYFTAGALIVTVILYGVKQSEGNDQNLFDRDFHLHFDWGYYVAIIAAAFSIICSVFVSVTICCIGRKK